jgi:hypothetical protein
MKIEIMFECYSIVELKEICSTYYQFYYFAEHILLRILVFTIRSGIRYRITKSGEFRYFLACAELE